MLDRKANRKSGLYVNVKQNVQSTIVNLTLAYQAGKGL